MEMNPLIGFIRHRLITGLDKPSASLKEWSLDKMPK